MNQEQIDHICVIARNNLPFALYLNGRKNGSLVSDVMKEKTWSKKHQVIKIDIKKNVQNEQDPCSTR